MNAFAGTGQLLRIAGRTELRRLIITILVFALVFLATAAQFQNLTPTLADREKMQAAASLTGTFTFLVGRFDHPETVAAMAVWKSGLFMVGALAVIAVMTMVRHTRAQEAAGRLELVRAGAVGRLAPLAAATAITSVTVVATAIASSVVLAGYGATGAQLVGFAFEMAIPALVAMGLAAVAAQVATTSRSANGLGIAIVLALYAARGLADVRGWTFAVRINPFGWATEMDPWGSMHWWPVAVGIVVAGLLLAGAGAVARRRDLGVGLLAVRAGRPAARALRGPVSLSLRQGWRVALAWAVVIALYGAVIATMLPTLDDFADSSAGLDHLLQELGGSGALVDSFLSAMAQFFGVAVACWGLVQVGSVRADEVGGRLETILAGAMSRRRILLTEVALALVGSVLLLLVAGVASGLNGSFGAAVGAPLARIPAVWVLIGVAALVVGAWPQHWWFAWAVVVATTLAGLFGEMLGLPRWVQDISVFHHVPNVPVDDLTWPPLMWMTLVSLALVTVAVWCFGRRDVPVAEHSSVRVWHRRTPHLEMDTTCTTKIRS